VGIAAYVESRDYAEHGLRWVDKVAAAESRRQLKLQLLSAKGLALSAVSGYAAPEVESTYRQARELCQEGGDPLELFPIVRGLGAYYFVRAQMATAGTLAEQCVELAASSRVPGFEVEALSFRGYTDCYLGRARAGRRALEDAIERGQSLHGPFPYTAPQHPVTAALAFVGNSAWAQGDPDVGETTPTAGLKFAAGLGRPFDEAYVHGWAAGLRNLQRRWDDAERHALACYAISEKYQSRIWLATATMQHCIAVASRSPAPQAVAILQQALLGFVLAGAEVGSGYFRWGIARGQRLLGDAQAARQTVDEALAHVQITDEAYIRGELLVLAAELETQRDKVEQLLSEAVQEGIELGAPTLSLRAGLAWLQLRGLNSANPQRDLAARAALDGRLPYPPSPHWIHDAWEGVRESLFAATGLPFVQPFYQPRPLSRDSSIEH